MPRESTGGRPLVLDNEYIAGLIDGYLDETLDSVEFAQLSAWLEADRLHRDAFARAITMHRVSHDLFASQARLDQIGEPLPGIEESRQLDDEVWQEVLEDALRARRRTEVQDKAEQLLHDDIDKQKQLQRYTHAPEPAPRHRTIVIPKTAVWLGLAAMLGLVAWVGWPGRQARGTVGPSRPKQPRRRITSCRRAVGWDRRRSLGPQPKLYRRSRVSQGRTVAHPRPSNACLRQWC